MKYHNIYSATTTQPWYSRKKGVIRMVASLDREKLVEFYNLSLCEIWPDKRSGLCWEGHYKRGNTVQHSELFTFCSA